VSKIRICSFAYELFAFEFIGKDEHVSEKKYYPPDWVMWTNSFYTANHRETFNELGLTGHETCNLWNSLVLEYTIE
jgi:hypothetical protein